MATYENNDYASKGVGTAGLTLGVIGTALASGVLNGNGLGGLFGNQNPATSPIYQLSQKDNEIALLKAQQYSDNKLAVLTERVSNLEARVLADEKTDPPFVPNFAVAPGWGPAFVSPFPPVPPVAAGSGTVTPATSTSTAQAS